MYEVMKKLIIKLISLAIVTILPIGIYLYTNDNSKYIFNYKPNINRNKYIIIAEFKPEERQLDIKQRVSFTNNFSEKTDRVYFHLCPDGFNSGYINIKNIKVNGKNNKFRLIGKSKSILMVYLFNPINTGEKIYIDITASVKLSDSMEYLGPSYYTYNIINWYPILVTYEDNKWNLNSYNYDISNYHVEFIIPKGYTVASTGRIIKKAELKDKTCYFIESLNVEIFLLTVKSSN